MIDELIEGLAAGRLIPYLGAGALAFADGATAPADAATLAAQLTARTAVPGKIKGRLTVAAQFIENFKHRRTLVAGMDAAFGGPAVPGPLHRALVALRPPLLVQLWYDDTLRQALAETGDDWSEIQALSQSEHFGTWTRAYGAAGQVLDAPSARIGQPGHVLLYRPWGGHAPGQHYLVSDSDFVEALTEIDIQTPIPAVVQELRRPRGFVFFGTRFDDQLTRGFARQIAKRSAGPHYAWLPEPWSRMERRFVAELGLVPLPGSPHDLADAVLAAGAVSPAPPRPAPGPARPGA